MSEVTNKQIYELLLGMQADLADVKKRVGNIESKVNTIQEHVARIDERTTQTEKITKIFNMGEVDKAIERIERAAK